MNRTDKELVAIAALATSTRCIHWGKLFNLTK